MLSKMKKILPAKALVANSMISPKCTFFLRILEPYVNEEIKRLKARGEDEGKQIRIPEDSFFHSFNTEDQ